MPGYTMNTGPGQWEEGANERAWMTNNIKIVANKSFSAACP
jgi:hypothetical protein